MENNDWLSRWEKGDIKFHQLEVNHYLRKYFPLLELNSNDTVLVPLCGKSQDISWLKQQQLQVIGAELSDQACKDFFSENNFEYSVKNDGNFTVYQNEHIHLFCGDFFKLKGNQIGLIKAIYDRAAMIALPPKYRQQYVNKIIELTDVGSKILLISLESSHQSQMPPFIINEAEIFECYQQYFDIRLLEKIPENTPHLVAKGYKDIHNVVYLLTRKN